ncbi:MAG: TfoX/Sxy family protein [Paracoccaceae bacterium]
MASDPRTVALLLERLSPAGAARARKMFGEYGIYLDDTFIGVVCDDRFHHKPTGPGRALAPELDMAPAYPGAKPSLVVPAERWDEADWLSRLTRSTAEALAKRR